jgi:hypothetical protein
MRGNFNQIENQTLLVIREYTPRRMNLGGGRFKTIKKLACFEVATFLFCFFIYLGLLAALVNLEGSLQNNEKASLLRCRNLSFLLFSRC